MPSSIGVSMVMPLADLSASRIPLLRPWELRQSYRVPAAAAAVVMFVSVTVRFDERVCGVRGCGEYIRETRACVHVHFARTLFTCSGFSNPPPQWLVMIGFYGHHRRCPPRNHWPCVLWSMFLCTSFVYIYSVKI